MLSFLKIPRSWAAGVVFAAVAVMGNFGVAGAQQITGDIGFGGAFTPANGSFASASLSTATSIDYNGDGIQNSGAGIVTLATGSFASLLFQTATLFDFSFNPFPVGGVNPLWQAGGFSFALDSVTINTQDANTLSLSGSGLVSGTGFTSTAGTWNFTGNAAGSSFVFSAGSGPVAPVPEPEIYGMMAVGLGLMGWAARRNRRKQQTVV